MTVVELESGNYYAKPDERPAHARVGAATGGGADEVVAVHVGPAAHNEERISRQTSRVDVQIDFSRKRIRQVSTAS